MAAVLFSLFTAAISGLTREFASGLGLAVSTPAGEPELFCGYKLLKG